MTLLLTPDTLATLKARSKQTRDEMPLWATRMNPDKWAKAYGQACELLDDQVKAASQRTDGTETAAVVLQYALDLVGFAMVKFGDPANPNPRKQVRLATDDTLQRIWDGTNRTLKMIAGETEAALREQAEQRYSALLAESQAALNQERDMAAQVADAAYSEAAAARQEAERLHAQLKAQQQLANKERYDLQQGSGESPAAQQ